ncbi:MAG: serine/threonine-protein kinase [Kofleriaceae bacterium]
MDPQQGPPQADHLIGQTIGNYLVTQKLGEGGMGAVYLAEHPSIGKKVALKVLHSEFTTNKDVTERFFNEAKAVNNIGHPNIVDIVDYGVLQSGTRDQLVYFIMEYLHGVTLSQLIRGEAPLPPERSLSICLQIADALSASHKCNIVHRDLKPDNIILVTRSREKDFVKLLDFGIAKLTGAAGGSSRTRTGIVMGTPAYMSPEQCEGRGLVDLRTDIYALGIVLYEMLTGRVPFIGEGYGEILVQHLTQAPVPPSQLRMMPPHVEAVVLKALEKRPDLRYPSMDDMMRAMADPVGFVEATGGLTGFLQRPLTPSNGPLPSTTRLTPAQLTPVPGSLSMIGATPSPGAIPTPPPMTPSPTTLRAAAGEMDELPAKSKRGFLVAGAVVVIGAVIGVAVVMSSKDTAAPVVAAGSSDGSAGSDTAAAGLGSADTPEPAAGSGSADHNTAGIGSGTGSGSGATAGSGSAASTASAGSGSASSAEASGAEAKVGAAGSGSVAPATVTIKVVTFPPGANVFVDRVAKGHTPATFDVARKARRVEVKVELRGYITERFSIDPKNPRVPATIKLRPVPVATPTHAGQGSGSATPPKRRTDDTRLVRPGD